MNELDRRLQSAFQRVDGFHDAHGTDFTANGPADKAFAFIHTLVPKAGTDAATQTAGKGEYRAGSSSRGAVRIALHNELASITTTAHGIALTEPGFDKKFLLPASGSDKALLASAEAFVTEATPVSATFIAHEMPADFLTVTQTLIDQFKAAGVGQDSGMRKQAGGTGALKDDRHKGELMLELLRSIVPNKYRNNPTVLAEWLTACHIERPTQKAKKTPAPTP